MTRLFTRLSPENHQESESEIMSSQATTADLCRGQRTLYETVNSQKVHEPITGVHARFTLPDEDTEASLDGDTDHDYPVLNFTDVEEVIDRDGDLETVLEPWHLPVVVANQDDGILDERSFQDVLNVLEALPPSIFVPDIVYNYDDMDEVDQELAITSYLLHVRAVQEYVITNELPIRILPTNKGWTVDHFKLYQDLYEAFGYTEMAFYCVQYSGKEAGNAVRQLRRHITNAIAALDLKNVFLIGRLGLDELLRFDPEVNGACGLRKTQSVESFQAWQKRREQALFANNNQTQSYLDNQW